jgi:hypothetical protein
VTTRDRLSDVYRSGNFTEAELRVLSYQFGIDKGGFFHALMETIFLADFENQARLALGFPDEVAAVRSFMYGGAKPSLSTRFRQAGVDL